VREESKNRKKDNKLIAKVYANQPFNAQQNPKSRVPKLQEKMNDSYANSRKKAGGQVQQNSQGLSNFRIVSTKQSSEPKKLGFESKK
jgi:hypothetical protein